MSTTTSKTPVLKASIDSRKLPIRLFGCGWSRHQRKLVYNYLATYANADGTSAYPSLTTIAADCGLSRRGLIRIVQWLADHYLLEKQDERSPRNTNNYTVRFSPEAQDKCQQTLLADAEEQELSGKAKRRRDGRVRGGMRAAATKKLAQESPAHCCNSDYIESPCPSDSSSHQTSDSGAQMVTREHVASDYTESHDRPCLPSLESPLPTKQPSHTTPVSWYVCLTSRLLSESFGQVILPTEEDISFIDSLTTAAEAYPGSARYVIGLWRYRHSKQWGGIDNPRGAWTVFRREIQTAMTMQADRDDLENILDENERLRKTIEGTDISVKEAAELVLAASNGGPYDWHALADYAVHLEEETEQQMAKEIR